MTDVQMLNSLRAQEQEALEQLMEKYHRYVYTIIYGIIHSPEDVEELVQDTFYAVWSHADAIQPGKLKPYLGTTARNRAKSWLRSHKDLPMAPDMIEIASCDYDPEDAAQRREMARIIGRALNRMRPKDKEIFLRYYYYLQTTEEISRIMGIPRNTVLSRLMRGRKQLEKILAKEDLG
jgi:RNA polymerase sigma-70 factor (ECF subfamily)